MLYNTEMWISKDVVRRSVRDEHREKFFAEVGGERIKDPFVNQPAPGGNVGLTLSLLEEAISLHGGDMSGLTMMKAALLTSGLSHGSKTSEISLGEQLFLKLRGQFFHE